MCFHQLCKVNKKQEFLAVTYAQKLFDGLLIFDIVYPWRPTESTATPPKMKWAHINTKLDHMTLFQGLTTNLVSFGP